MRKVLLVALPVIALCVVAGIALSKSDHEREAEKSVHKHTWVFGGGYRLGVVLSELEKSDKEKLSIDHGVEVKEVLKDSPAEKAGIKEGDILLKINGTEVSDSEDVQRFLRKLDEARELSVDLLRNGKPLTLSVVPEKKSMAAVWRGFGHNYLGVQLQELDPDLASYFKVDPKGGVLVTRVEKDSPAEIGGMRSGDVIMKMNGKKISDPDDLVDQLEDLKEGETAEISVQRHGAEKILTVKPEQRSFPHRGDFEFPDVKALPDLPDMHENMEDLKLQMEELKKELEQELKPEMEKLKKELQELSKKTT